MNAPFRLVFDAAQRQPYYFEWLTPVLMVGVALVVLYFRRREQFVRIFVAVWIAGVVALGGGAMACNMRFFFAVRAIARNGGYSTVEGVVEDFKPMPNSGHAMESFRLDGHSFEYSDYTITPCFNNAASNGGPIRPGLHVRIGYLSDRCIVRLEIADEPDSSVAPPKTVLATPIFPAAPDRRPCEANAALRARSRVAWRKPDDFADVPTATIEALHRQGCLIREPARGFPDGPPRNLFQADIGRAGQRDWVALCSTNGVSHIVVLWAGSAQCPALTETTADDGGCPPGYAAEAQYLEAGNARDVVWNAHAIGVEDSKIPAPFKEQPDHQTIRVTNDENVSLELYCVGGRWFELNDGD